MKERAQRTKGVGGTCWPLGLLAWIFMAVNVPAATNAAALFADPPVARAKGFEIKRSQLDEAFLLLKANAAGSGQVIKEDRRPYFEARLLDRLIATRLLVARATEADRQKAAEKADAFVAQTKNRLASEEMFRLQLKGMNLTPEQFRERILEQSIGDEVVNREVRAGIKISEAEAREYFTQHSARFAEPETIRLAHIFFSTTVPAGQPTPQGEARRELPPALKEEKRLLAQSVLARARKGEDFARLAKEFSEDQDFAKNQGIIRIQRGQVAPEIEAAAFALGAGQVSELITSAAGYHLLKVLEKIPAKTPDFSQAAPRVQRFLADQEAQKRLPAYLQQLRREAGVEILVEELKIQTPTAP